MSGNIRKHKELPIWYIFDETTGEVIHVSYTEKGIKKKASVKH